MADDKAAHEGAEQRQRPKQTYGTVPWEPGKSRVEPETLAYLTEVSEHLATLEDPEERELLLNNVLDELEGKELRIAADAVCSRLLETLLAPAAPRHLISFLGAFTDEDDMYKLAGSAFGSHVAEALLSRLGAAAAAGQLSGDDAAALEGLLDGLAAVVGDQLHDYLMDRHATHVARALLRAAAGRDVVPASKQGKQKQQDRVEGGGGTAKQQGGAGDKAVDPLAEKLSGSHALEHPPPLFPGLVSRLARMLPCYEPSSMAALAKNTYSGPFLQGVLRAVAGDSAAAAAEAAPGCVLASVTESHMSKLLRDDVYSRVLEVVLAVAPPALWSEFHERFLKGRLMPLTSHHAANFVVQAALAGAQGKQQVAVVFEELQGFLGPLLLKRRSGVIAALIAACGRAGACQREAAAALAKALGGLPQWQGREGTSFLAPALMTLDTGAVLAGGDDGGARLSTPGCALLAAILGFPKNASRDFAASVAALTPADAARCAADPAGSRVLEALITGPAGTETKKQLLGKLAGSWGKVALKAPGSFLVERAFGWGDIEAKEAIISSVAAQAQQLQHCYWWPRLSRALGVEAYQRSADEWRKRAASQAATKRAYDQMFGGLDGGEAGGGGGGAAAGSAGTGDGRGKKRRKEQKAEGKKARRALEAQQQQELHQQQQEREEEEEEEQRHEKPSQLKDAGGSRRKGKRKNKQEEEQQPVEELQAAAAAEGDKLPKKERHKRREPAAVGAAGVAGADVLERGAKKREKRREGDTGARNADGGGDAGALRSMDGIMAMLGFGPSAAAAAAPAAPGRKAKKKGSTGGAA
ncbi:puf protein [Monoraphidium neglectum]|uniref:Puf protein n=1 Tax=Monoraphidium neglectum TaxID=145388 RepID=A0A0D2MR75_9CHLO|nr:puf protein [Monoraphidium neglectum]KIY97090.1 puf protein [Monoraphidium neglectum]|eukprot:XP_013896110.1 puf protein [Monoraphidium neglectum]